jgi:hypothetical protein
MRIRGTNYEETSFSLSTIYTGIFESNTAVLYLTVFIVLYVYAFVDRFEAKISINNVWVKIKLQC